MSDAYSSIDSAASGVPIDELVRKANPDYGVDTSKLKTDLSRVGKEEAAATDAAVTRQLGAMESNYGSLKKKLDGIGPVQVQPWNAEQEYNKRVQSPLEAFGSTASVFALLASAFTKQPMINGLNAAAAAINSVRQNDINGYERAHEAWKENTNLALKRHEMEREAFKDAIELYKNDPIAGGAELKAVAARFGAQTKLSLIDAGYIPQVIEMQDKEAKNALSLTKSVDELDKHSQIVKSAMLARQEIEQQNAQRAQAGRPQLTPIEQSQIIGDIKRRMTQAMTTSALDTQATLARAERIKKEAADAGVIMTDEEAYTKARQEIKDSQVNPATRERVGSIEKAKQQWLEQHPEASGIIPSEVENRIRANANAHAISSSEPNIDDATAKMLADRVIVGDKSALVGLGYGAVGAANRARVMNVVTEEAAKRGLDGAALARAAIEYSATGRGAGSMAQQEARVTSAISKAQATAPRVLEISDKIDRTRFPSVNSIILAAQKGTGGENVVRLGIAVETLINNYALALGGGNSAMTDSSKQHARELLERSYSKGQMHAAVDQMMIEMDSELQGLKSGLKHYLEPPAPKNSDGWSIKKVQ